MNAEVCKIAPEKWERKPLYSVCTNVTSGGTPSRRINEYFENGIWPWVKTQELHDYWIEDTDEKITDLAIANSAAKILPENTILVAMYGATVGQLGIIRKSMTCNQACCALIIDERKADFRYVFYQLLHHKQQFKNLAVGAAQQNLNSIIIREFVLPLPPLPEQRAIADVLSALDDKIELNRRINRTLEDLAQAIYKHMFIDNPERAKWDKSVLGENFNITMGQSPPGSTYNEYGDGSPFFQGRADFDFRYPTNRVYCTAATRYAKAGDTLISVRAPVGDQNMALTDCAIGRGVAAIRHNSESRSFTYYTLQTFRSFLKNFEMEGTVFGSINKDSFHSLEFLRPPDGLINQFENMCFPLDQQIENNTKQNATLAELRDTLLPKLMSGQVRVNI